MQQIWDRSWKLLWLKFYLYIIYEIHFIMVRGSLNKFPDFFRMGTFIDSTHIKL